MIAIKSITLLIFLYLNLILSKQIQVYQLLIRDVDGIPSYTSMATSYSGWQQLGSINVDQLQFKKQSEAKLSSQDYQFYLLEFQYGNKNWRTLLPLKSYNQSEFIVDSVNVYKSSSDGQIYHIDASFTADTESSDEIKVNLFKRDDGPMVNLEQKRLNVDKDGNVIGIKEATTNQPEKTFLQKYWMYILPAAILLLFR